MSGPYRWLHDLVVSLFTASAGAGLTLVVCGSLPVLRGWQAYTITSGSMTPLVLQGDVVVAAPYHGELLALGSVDVLAPLPQPRHDAPA
jgi:signal peptidase I